MFLLGSELGYHKVGKDSFLITLQIYRDCKMPMPTTMPLIVNGKGCSYQKSLTPSLVSCKNVTPVGCGVCTSCSSCTQYASSSTCTTKVSIEKMTYQALWIADSTTCCEFVVSFKRAGRSSGASVCCAYENMYNYAELNRCISGLNHSPVAQFQPPFVINVGQCFSYNGAVNDTVDKDSLSYHIEAPLIDAQKKVTYSGSYNEREPVYYDGFPKRPNPPVPNYSCKGFFLDSITGDLIFKPLSQQQSYMVIAVKEWRKDSLGIMKQIGLIRRDFSLQIFTGLSNSAPVLKGITKVDTVCEGRQVCLGKNSIYDFNTLPINLIKDSVWVNVENNLPGSTVRYFYDSASTIQNFEICWTPTAANFRAEPYSYRVTAFDNGCEFKGIVQKTYRVFVAPKIHDSIAVTPMGCGIYRFKTIFDTSVKYQSPRVQWVIPFQTQIDFWTDEVTVQFKKGGKIPFVHRIFDQGCSHEIYDTLIVPPQREIWVGSDTSICSGNSVTLKALVKNFPGRVKFKWQYGSVKDTISEFTVSPSISTRYVVVAFDSTTCQEVKDTIWVMVNPLPPPFQIYKKAGKLIVDSIKGMAPIWFRNGMPLAQSGWSIQPSLGGNYTARLQFPNGCFRIANINFSPPIQLSLPADTQLCQWEMYQISPNISGGTPPFRYKWLTGVLADSLSTLQWTVNQTKSLILVVSDSVGQSSWDTIHVTALPKPGKPAIRRNGDLLFVDSGQISLQPEWYFQQNRVSLGKFSINPLDSGIYSFVWKNTLGCTESDFYDFYFRPKVQLPSDTAVCKDASLTINSIIKNGRPPFTYRWNTGNQQDTLSAVSITPNASQTLSLWVTDRQGIRVSDTININVLPTPPSPVVKQVGGFLYADSNVVGLQPSWKIFGTPMPIKQFGFWPTQNGRYTIRFDNGWGCSSETDFYFSFLGSDRSLILVSWDVFPNPADEYVEISLGSEKGTLELLDLHGKLLRTLEAENRIQWDLKGFPQGVYLLRFIQENGMIRRSPLVIRH